MNDLNPALQKVVEDYYGEVLKNNHDLKTSACCPIDSFPEHLVPLLAAIHPEVTEKFYGCGSPIPPDIKGKTILDLGCGSGRDVYLLSQLVGAEGKVIGIDMTLQQLTVARRHLQHHTKAFGYGEPNVEFHHGMIEDLAALGIADNSIDVVISNCVINLSMNKPAVFREIFRVLKPGGELYFSDVFASRRIPAHLMQDRDLLGECLAGALYIEDFRRLMRDVGCLDYRTLSSNPIVLQDAAIRQKIGMIDFFSNTCRAFKCDLEDVCEDYGHVVTYRGTIEHMPHSFRLDDHHLFRTGMPERVCGNSWKMLMETRFARHFSSMGDFSTHYGLFACGPGPTQVATSTDLNGACC